MNRRNKVIVFFVAALLSYGSLFALIGPEKVRVWYQDRQYHHRHYHDHHCDHDDNRQNESESENL